MKEEKCKCQREGCDSHHPSPGPMPTSVRVAEPYSMVSSTMKLLYCPVRTSYRTTAQALQFSVTQKKGPVLDERVFKRHNITVLGWASQENHELGMIAFENVLIWKGKDGSW